MELIRLEVCLGCFLKNFKNQLKDCSGVHRSLGTHLTFIRSADLDQAWTWKQLRCMQVGGNAKARAFFRANGGETSDKQVKYSSRAANLYKSKIAKLVSCLLNFRSLLPVNSGRRRR